MGSFFPEDLIEEIKDSNEITDVISEYIHFTTTGSSYKALCPFHSEKTPSFVVNKEKQIFKCFGCGEGGDVIGFIMKIENLDFIEAVKLLANRANIELKDAYYSEEAKKQLQERMLFYEMNKKAARFYYNCLTNQPGVALNYLLKRGLSRKVINSFGLGYAPNKWNELLQYLVGQGYDLKDIERCGLIIQSKSQNDYYDRFRNRIIFPIFDIQGNVIGFGGRVLDNTLPKYLNSPETQIFRKSKTLYGLNIARKNIRNGQLILVEGYMDVISLHQHGFKNCVGTLGTSLTKDHARILKKYCNEVVVCFDGDTAGMKATLRSIGILSEGGCNVKVLMLPDNMDPDDFIQKRGKKEFEQHLNKAIGLIDYRLFLAKKKYSPDTIEGKIKLAKEIASILKKLNSPIEVEAYIQKVEKEIGISKEALSLEVYGNKNIVKLDKNTKYSSGYKRDNKYIQAVPPAEQKGHIIAEKQLIKFMLTNFSLIPCILEKIKPEDFSVGRYQLIVEYILNNYKSFSNIEDMKEVLADFKEDINEILNIDIEHIDINRALEKYMINLKKYKLYYKLKKLEEQQQKILDQSNLNKEEVENELLKIGVEIMKINLEIQKLQP